MIIRDRIAGRVIALAATFSLAPFLLIAWAVRDVHRRVPEVWERSTQVLELTRRLDYVDEALTGSALLAVSTGDPAWEARYDALDPLLVDILASLRTVTLWLDRPGLADSIVGVADTLGAMEHRAMAMARDGERARAWSLLRGRDYAAAKQRYQNERTLLLADLSRWMRAEEERTEAQMEVIFGLVSAAFLLLLLTWSLLAYLVRRHIRTREQAERELRAAEERLRAIVDVAPVAIIRVDRDRAVEYWNRAAEQIFGWSADEVLGRPYPLEAASGERTPGKLFERGFGGELLQGIDLRRERKDGRVVDVRMWNAAVRGADGQIQGLVGVFADVTEQRGLERRLRQAAKLEAIGQLAGGIAHDFNNVMTAVQGHADLLLEAVSEGDPMAHDIREIRRSAGRATELTRQLLAFSRRQVLQPRVLELGAVVRGLEPMLKRLLGERIRLETAGDAASGLVKADPTQLEQVVVNLAVNARDAMPGGGLLRIAVEGATMTADDAASFEYEVLPGPYVRLRVSDSGSGMDESTRQQVFEPFFTTKPSGQGTGLGLSTVYGIVKQSGGYVWVHSGRGAGTEFEILLPRVEAEDGSPPSPNAAAAPPPRSVAAGGETLLLVEDDDAVRALAARVLDGHGYAVTAAASPAEALARIEAGDLPALDVLVTDVVLPDMGGQELARRVAEHFPEIPTLFVSGYTEDEVLKRTVASGASAFLAKPFSPHDLARSVRAVLDAHGDRR